MGLIYDPGDSSSITAALSANLAAAESVLDAVQSATSRLRAALGTGELSGRGYAAVQSLFAQVIAPCVADAKAELGAIRDDLERYSYQDSKIRAFGVLKEDELKKQLEATRRQRDATEHLIEVNTAASNSLTAVPALSEALRVKNTQLEMVLNQLENDIRDLEGKLTALQQFDSASKGLFMDRLDNLAAATGDTVALLNQLDDTKIGLSVVGSLGTGAGTLATRRDILNYLGDKKITKDATGRLRWGDRYLYRPEASGQKAFLYARGKQFNQSTEVRIDHYRQPIKAGVRGLAAPLDDFHGWSSASALGKLGKGLGAAGAVLTVAGNADTYFRDGVQATDWPDFAVDTGVDLAHAAVSAGIGAAAGSFFLPPLGTVVGAAVGLIAGAVIDAPAWNGISPTDAAKETIKKIYR
ncbi:hypothetical protein [Leifsonia sp. AG29]|uniref:hypothetical protein n=1 Tax=Leifsonia sp. AG29 TaxID=2598860 RepID=UPI00131EA601|nr:hypothetical protein [Leifsonia sp. AG29]